MRNRIIAAAAAAVLAASLIPGPVSAAAEPGMENAEAVADAVEEITGTEEIATNVEPAGGDFIAENADMKLSIPGNGSGEVRLEDAEGAPISVDLPGAFDAFAGELAGEGTVVYHSPASSAAAAVQCVEEEQDGVSVSGFRSVVTIAGPEAAHEYPFAFDLPRGCSLLTAEEYHGDSSDAGFIYIVDEEQPYRNEETGRICGEIIGVIDPAWARDADGRAVETSYEISGNTLTQIIVFDHNSRFPIVADPTATLKPRSQKVGTYMASTRISHSVIGLGSFAGGTVSKGLTRSAKKKIAAAVTAKLGSKFVPVVGAASWALAGYATLASCKGYNYTRVKLKYEKWTTYRRQGGKWVKGFLLKGKKLKLKLIR